MRAFPLRITWESAHFSFHLIVSAQLPPRRAALFYFIRHDEKHVTKNRMESPKFIILSSLPETPKAARLCVESWTKLAAVGGIKTSSSWRFVADLWRKSCESKASLGRRPAMAGWLNLPLLPALWATAVASLCGPNHYEGGGGGGVKKTGSSSVYTQDTYFISNYFVTIRVAARLSFIGNFV